MKMMKLNSKYKYIALTMMIVILLPLAVIGTSTSGNIIITPKVLEGDPGSAIQVDKSLLVQEVTMTNVKLIDVSILNDKDKIITRYPNKEGKYTLVEKGTNKKVGFVQLKPSTIGNEVPISYNLEGEFPYYQEGLVFNTLRNAHEGEIYFYKRKTGTGQPMILQIGNINNGTFNPKEFIEIKNKVIQIKQHLK